MNVKRLSGLSYPNICQLYDLVNEKVDTSNTAPLSVVLNWSSEMEK